MAQREGSGILSPNENRSNERQPFYKGELNVGGQEYWLSAWVKDGRKGEFISIAAERKQDKQP